jgi:hypothetical protein
MHLNGPETLMMAMLMVMMVVMMVMLQSLCVACILVCGPAVLSWERHDMMCDVVITVQVLLVAGGHE